MVPFLLPLLHGRGGAVSGGQGFYDPRSWLITLGILVLVVGFGWLLRRPVRRRRRGRPPVPDRPIGPEDDEEFLRELDRRFPPR